MATRLSVDSEALGRARIPAHVPLAEPLIARYKSRFLTQGQGPEAVEKYTRSAIQLATTVEFADIKRTKGRYASAVYEKVIAVCRRSVKLRLLFRGGKAG